jgi:hypothetical protein
LGFTRLKSFGGEDEGFANWQKIGFGLERIRSGLSQARSEPEKKEKNSTH